MYIYRRLKYRFGMYNRKKQKSNGFSLLLYMLCLVSIIAVLGLLVAHWGERIYSLSVKLGADKMQNEILSQCSTITTDILKRNNVTYSSIISESKDQNGRIISLQTDFAKVNVLKCELERDLSEFLKKFEQIEYGIPLGSLVFDDYLASCGPDIPVEIMSSSYFEIEFSDTFTEAGVNQTKHTYMFNITVYSKLHSLFETTERTIETSVPVAESIIVGETPDMIL